MKKFITHTRSTTGGNGVLRCSPNTKITFEQVYTYEHMHALNRQFLTGYGRSHLFTYADRKMVYLFP